MAGSLTSKTELYPWHITNDCSNTDIQIVEVKHTSTPRIPALWQVATADDD